jgi:hypothetical protein
MGDDVSALVDLGPGMVDKMALFKRVRMFCTKTHLNTAAAAAALALSLGLSLRRIPVRTIM